MMEQHVDIGDVGTTIVDSTNEGRGHMEDNKTETVTESVTEAVSEKTPTDGVSVSS